MATASAPAARSPGQTTLLELILAIPKFIWHYFLKWIFVVIIIAAVGFLLFAIGKLAYNYQQQGSAGVAVTHIQVATQAPRSFIGNSIAQFSPELADLWEGKAYSDSFSSEVEANAENPDLGVKITNFEATSNLFMEGSDVKLTGSIAASSLTDDTTIAAYCTLEGYRNERPIPAQLFGNTASGNTAVIPKNYNAEFQARCTFPPDPNFKADKSRIAKIATLVVNYRFTTQATQKLWFLDKNTLLSLEGKNAFDYYGINGQVDSKGRSRSKSTAGPINLGVNIDLPQPFTDNTPYILTAQLSPNIGWPGNLEKLESLTLQVPSTRDLDLVLEGDANFNIQGSKCDFDYIGPGEDQFKIYELRPELLAKVNQDCSTDTLTSLALSKKDCIDFFKSRPTFSCLFEATRVPQSSLQFDAIRSEAKYLYRTEKQAAIEIRKTPEVPLVG